MKHSGLSRAIVAIAMMLIGWLPLLAHDFEVDGIFYNKTSDNTAAVTYKGSYGSTYEEYVGDVVIPSSVNYNGVTYSVIDIGESAFSGCFSLTSIEIPNSVTSIGDEAFWGCSKLTSVEIPNSVTSIGDETFGHCDNLTSIQIPNSVTSVGDGAFYWCKNLTSIVVDSGNTIYDSRNGCNAIIETASNTLIAGCKNTIIHNSVTSIGEKAFYFCFSLTIIEIPNSVTSIGDYAFHGCSSLKSIEIPNSVTSIGDRAFSGCSSLKSIVVDSGNSKYDSRNGCNAIIETASNTLITGCQNTIIPNSVTSIEDHAFYGCTRLTSIEIPNSVKGVGYMAFNDCSNLISIEIPNSVTFISNYAFSGCNNLTKITCLATTPPRIGSGTFSYSNYSADLYVPAGCKATYEAAEYWNDFTNIIELEPDLEEGATFEYEGLTYKVIVKGGELAVITSENGEYFGDIVIPSSVYYNGITYSVTSIGDEAFGSCHSLTSIQIGNSVTSIGTEAFAYCSGLTSIQIGNSVTSIGTEAFAYCSGLTSIEIPNSVTSIGEGAFYDCSGLTSIEIPNSVTNILGQAFSYCKSLTSIVVDAGNSKYDSRNGCNAIIETASNTLKAGCQNTIIPNSVTSIGGGAFFGCSSLTSIQIPNSVTSIGYEAFDGCSSLTSIEIPNSVTSIGGGAFERCSGLTSIEIPNSVTSIEGSAFSGCSSLTSIVVDAGNSKYDSRNGCNAIIETASNTLIAGCKNTIIPNSVTSIGWSAFYRCSGLTSIEIPNSVTSIGDYAFSYCSSLTSIQIPNSVTSIGELAFWGCSNLTSIEIPNSVTSIGRSAFSSCSSLIDVVIGNSVTSIGDYAFEHCSSLTKITCLAITPPTIKSGTFSNYSADLFVPAGCKEAYEAAEYWNKFTNIIEIEEPNVNLFIDDFAINAGETKELAINLTNEIAFTGFQADLCLPDGLEIEQEEGDYIFELTDRKGSDHVITSGKQANGAIRILCFSTKLIEFSGSEGAIVKFRVTAANDFVGNYEINIKDIILAQTDESEYQLPATTTKVEACMLAKSITLDRTEVSLEASQTTTLLATILPDNTSVKTVIWTSSDEDVAIVDENGVVTAIAIGEATITATTTDGTNLSASCKVTVVPTLGDANNDAVINVTDIMMVASYILGNTPEGFVFEAADVTKDGKINIIDIVAIANIILNGGTASNVSAQRCAPNTSDVIKIEDFAAGKNQSQQVAIEMTNASDYSACQMDIRLPKGMSIAECELASATTDHMVAYRELPDGAVRVLVYSLTCQTLPDSEEGIIRLRTTTDNRFEGGEIVVENILFADRGQNEYRLYDSVANVNLATGVSATDIDCVVYAENRSIVIISPCDQQATITSIDGISRIYSLNEGRNEIVATQAGVYIVTLADRTFKVMVK